MSRKNSLVFSSEISRSAIQIGYQDKNTPEKLAFKSTFGSPRTSINAPNYYSISGINGMQDEDDYDDSGKRNSINCCDRLCSLQLGLFQSSLVSVVKAYGQGLLFNFFQC